MSAQLKQLVEELRRVWEPPTRTAWSLSDVKLVKLLKAIDDLPAEDDLRRRLAIELSEEHTKVGQSQFDIADALAAYDRARNGR